LGSFTSQTNVEPRIAPPQYEQDQMKAHLLELELTLARIDSGRSYYHILGVDRTDSEEEIKSSYQQLIEILYPPSGIAEALSHDIVSRIGRSFAKASQAFGVLACYTRRREYDGALSSTARRTVDQRALRSQSGVPAPEARDSSRLGSLIPHESSGALKNRSSIVASPGASSPVFKESYSTSSDNRRRCGRMKLSIPARVTGHDQAKGKWHEMTETIDVSRTGARLRLHRRVKPGTVIFLTLPMPTKLRAHGLAEQSYNVYALIRVVDPPSNGSREVGVEFLGEHPPAGFIEKPWAIYRARRKGANERRRHRREESNEAVVIEYLDETGQPIGRDEARTENIGRRGVRVVGTTSPLEFDVIRIGFERLHFFTLATLRDRYRGKDGLERLCLQLVEKEWPA